MTLREILVGVEGQLRAGHDALEREITGLHHDSRQVKPGYVFVAMKGESSDGNRFIDSAIQSGAVAIVSDSAQEPPRPGIAWMSVPHGRRALARLAANFYGDPAGRLKLAGITGTNGKTTTAFLLAQILRFAGRGEPVLIGTVEYHYARQIVPAPHTTPESLELARIFAAATDPKLGKLAATEAVMEVSSHALAQERVFGLRFDVAIFTNLTRDHLDFHHSMEEYFSAKQKLFTGCGAPPPRVAVLNADDPHSSALAQIARAHGSEIVEYGIERGEIRAEKIKLLPSGTEFLLHTPHTVLPVRSTLVGRVNVYNLLAACAAALARGVDAQTLVAAIPRCQGAPGRFQRVDCGQPFAVIVDYAHTDDALKNLTALARDFVAAQKSGGRVITLFGCGGDRDRSKRPLMGSAAGIGSDFVVLTSDNPRGEDPMDIIEDALPGLRATNTRFAVEADRKKAIELAIREAQPGDIVLLAGKGHEKIQTTRGESIHFDDVEVARQALEAAGYGAVARTGVPR